MKQSRMSKILILYFSVFLAFGFALNADTKTLPPEVREELDTFITGVMDAQHIPGLSACIVKKKRVIWKGTYGYANFEKNLPVTEDTLFQLASLSKLATMTAIMKLYEDGKFDLHDDIDDYLPYSVRSPLFPDTPITFYMLLTHTSGLKDNWAVMPYYMGSDSPIPLSDYTYNYLVPGGSSYDPDLNWWAIEPGSERIYNNNAYVLIAYLVETISGKTFADYCDEFVFAPLSMNTTTWFLAGLNLDTLAMPYYFNGTTFVPYGYYGYSDYPAGLLKTSIEELSHFLAAYMWRGKYQTGRVLKPQTVDLILTHHIPAYGGLGFQGLAWIYYLGEWGHSGGDAGVATTIYFDPETEVGIIVLTNGESHTGVKEVKAKLLEVGDAN